MGKTVMACAFACELAILVNPDADHRSLKVNFVGAAQDLASTDLVENQPLVIDDSDIACGMFQHASENEYLKSMFWVEVPRSIRLLGRWVNIPKGPRIFTTNCLDVDSLLALKDGRVIGSDHAGGIHRRFIFCRLLKKAYSPVDRRSHEDITGGLVQDGFDRLAQLRRDGAW